MAKHNLRELDQGQLQTMWNFLKLQRKNTCTKEDVRILKEHLDIIRQAMVQKTAGQRDTDPDTYLSENVVLSDHDLQALTPWLTF